MESFLEFSVFEKLIKNLARKSILFKIDGYSQTILIRLISNIPDTFNFFIFNQIGYFNYQFCLIHLVRYFCNNNLKTLFIFNNISHPPDNYRPASGGISICNIFLIIYNSAGWKIRAFNKLG